jgi:hypothetical protein
MDMKNLLDIAAHSLDRAIACMETAVEMHGDGPKVMLLRKILEQALDLRNGLALARKD